MKKNLISIVILALLIVNVVLTAIMMVNVSNASKKTAELVDDIAGVLQLELSTGAEGWATKNGVSLENTEVYKIANQMTIPLQSNDGKSHYCLVSIALSMNKEDEGYKSYGATVSSYESLITSCVYDVIGSYSMEEAQANKDIMREEILTRVQAIFDSSFIYQVSFSDIMFQ